MRPGRYVFVLLQDTSVLQLLHNRIKTYYIQTDTNVPSPAVTITIYVSPFIFHTLK